MAYYAKTNMAFVRNYKIDTSQRLAIFSALNEQRLEGTLCDVTLIVEKNKFSAHRGVLAAASTYFRSMFSDYGSFIERTQKEIEIHSVKSCAMKEILDLLYIGSMTINISNVFSIVEAAELLMLDNVKGYCFRFMDEALTSDKYDYSDLFNMKRCMDLYSTCHDPSSVSLLKTKCDSRIDFDFNVVILSNAFLNLSFEEVKQLLTRDFIYCDEKVIFDAATRWLLHNETSDVEVINAVMECVRFPLIESKVLINEIQTHPLAQSFHCQKLIREAYEYQLQPLEQSALQTPLTKPRRLGSSLNLPLIYCLSGTDHFMCYMVGYDKWFSLRAPSILPKEDEDTVYTASLIAAEHYVYACISVKDSQQVGHSIIKSIMKYDIFNNSWTDCELPDGASKKCLFMEARNKLYACSRSGVECYYESENKWKVIQILDINPCEFSVSDDEGWLHFYNLESGVCQSVNTTKVAGENTCTQVMTPMRFSDEIVGICKIHPQEVLLTIRSASGISRKVFNIRWHMWESGPSKESQGWGVPMCMDPKDPWQIVSSHNSHNLYILGSKSGLSNIPTKSNKKFVPLEPHTSDTKLDGVLPFYKFNLKSKQWKRLASLPEALSKNPLTLCACQHWGST